MHVNKYNVDQYYYIGGSIVLFHYSLLMVLLEMMEERSDIIQKIKTLAYWNLSIIYRTGGKKRHYFLRLDRFGRVLFWTFEDDSSEDFELELKLELELLVVALMLACVSESSWDRVICSCSAWRSLQWQYESRDSLFVILRISYWFPNMIRVSEWVHMQKSGNRDMQKGHTLPRGTINWHPVVAINVNWCTVTLNTPERTVKN